MSIAKKIICLLLALALCFYIAGCKKTKKKQIIVIKRPVSASDAVEDDNTLEDDDTTYDDEADFEDVYISDRELAEKEETAEEIKIEYSVKATELQLTKDYMIVYPKGNDQLRQAAQKLSKYLSANRIDIAVTDDTAKAKEKEILLGDTNRKKSSLAENKFAVTVSGKKLLFESGNFNGVVKAVSWFISKTFEKGKVNTLSGEYEFVSTIKRPSGTYNFVWGDEFDGNALDTSKWDFSSSIGAESSFKLSREPEAIKVEDGLLKLTARRWFDPDNNQIQAIAPYTVESKKHLNFQYGYLEMKARIPFGAGAWPSLWLSGACREGAVVSNLFEKGDIISSPFSAEIDIIEYTSLETNMHKWFYEKDTPDTKGGHTSLGDVTLMSQNGLSLYNKEKNATALDSKAAIEVFDFWTDLYTEYGYLKEAEFYNRFRVGVVPLGIAPLATYMNLYSAAPEIAGRWSVALVPASENGNRSIAGAGTGCGIISKSENKEEAWEFLKWWTSAETQTRYKNTT